MDSDVLIEMKLFLDYENACDFNFNKASLLQGVLMEQIDPTYAEKLHMQGLKPYSQCIRIEEQKKVVWYIRTLSAEARQNIVQPLLADTFQEFYLEHEKKNIKIIGKELAELPIQRLFQNFYSDTASRSFTIEFLSPTAFKKNGKYSFYPEMFNIYQSLMRKFDSVSQKESMFSDETLEQLTASTEVTAYNLKSVTFSLEGVRIPAFIGVLNIKIHGSQTMINFANLLFQFGNFSGVGIKTAMGMGSIHVTERKKKVIK